MKNIILLSLCSIVLTIYAEAQTVINSVSGTFEYSTLDQAEIDSMDTRMLATQKKNVTLIIDKGSVSGISKLAVMAGMMPGSNNLFYKEYTYGTDGDFSDGTSYYTSGNIITVGTGTLKGMPKYFIEVFEIMENGDHSVPVKCIVQ